MAIRIDGKILAEKIRQEVKQEVIRVKQQGIYPKLAVIMVGQDSASKVYVRNKSRACDQTGIQYEEYLLPENTTMDKLLLTIEELNKRKDINAILLQSPIPKQLDIQKAFQTIMPQKDVDGFHPINVGNLTLGQDSFISCTPYGVIKMLQEYNISMEGKHAVIIGRSNIVGKPLLQCLLSQNATVTVCHSRTKNIETITRQADILIAALGKPKFVTREMVKQGAVVIDVGINRTEEGTLVGDVDFNEVDKIASYLTPVPGGVRANDYCYANGKCAKSS